MIYRPMEVPAANRLSPATSTGCRPSATWVPKKGTVSEQQKACLSLTCCLSHVPEGRVERDRQPEVVQERLADQPAQKAELLAGARHHPGRGCRAERARV